MIIIPFHLKLYNLYSLHLMPFLSSYNLNYFLEHGTFYVKSLDFETVL
jgi:hypothetical protein